MTVIHYDFTYYIEKVLNLVISESKKIDMQAFGYPTFVPISSIYQTGRYYTINRVEYFSNTSFPYRIPRGGATKLDLQNHLIYPSGFTVSINSYTNPTYGTLTKISDFVYTYTPDDTQKLSGRFNFIFNLKNTNLHIDTKVKLGFEFEVDNTQSVQTNYVYDSIIYTDLEDAISKNFEGYSSYEFFPNFAGGITGITEGNIGIWEGKFKIPDEGYKYILYKGGRGPSKLLYKIGDATDYEEELYITENQSGYMFVSPSYAYRQVDFNKGDIVYFKAYLLGKTLATGASAWLNIRYFKRSSSIKC